MKLHIFLSLLLTLTLLTGCAANAADINPADMFSERDLRTTYDATKAAIVSLNGNTISSTSPLVMVSGSTATLTGEGTFILRGTLTDGMIIVDAGKDDKLHIILDGADITSATSAPLYIRKADKVFVTLADNTDNALSNGGQFVQFDKHDIDAALYSRDDLTINGSGTLHIASPAGHGIVTKDDLVLAGGIYDISTGKDGLKANNSIRITGVTMNIEAGDDAMQAEHDEDQTLGFVYISSGTVQIDANGKGVCASGELMIDNGTINIAQSEEGLEGRSVIIHGGTITVRATDDGVNASGDDGNVHITVTGGELYIDAEGDGIDANGSLYVSGGHIVVAGPTHGGNSAVDYDDDAAITGGTVIAYGPSGMAQGFGTDSTQGAILLETPKLPAGTVITLKDADSELISVIAQKPFSTVLISVPAMMKNGTYTVMLDEDSHTITLDGFLYSNVRGRFRH